MSNVTNIADRRGNRLTNPNCQHGRTYMVLRDSDAWLHLHEIRQAILERFGTMDSEPAISARIREIRREDGVNIASHEVPGGRSKAHVYKWFPPHDDGGKGAA